MRRIPV